MKGVLKRVLATIVFIGCASTAIAAGPPATITVTATPDKIPANGNAFLGLAAEVKDSSGNPVDNGTSVAWTVQTLGVLDAAITTTTDGIATNKLRAPIVTGTSTVTAAAASANDSAAVVFTGPAIAGEVFPQLKSLAANGTAKLPVIARFWAANGELVADGSVVQFTTTLGSITACGLTRDGYVTALLTAGSLTGDATVTASCGDSSLESRVWMVGSVTKIVLGFSETSLPANGTSSCDVSAALSDADGKPAPDGLVVTFTTDKGTIVGSALTENGTAVTTLTSGTTAGMASVTATYGGVTESAVIGLYGDAMQILVSTDSTSIPADASSNTRVAITLIDANDVLVSGGTPITLTASNGTLHETSVTAVDGVAATVLTSNATAGEVTITATRSGLSGEGTVYFAGAPATVDIESSVDSMAADGASTCIVSGQVSDSGGNPVPDGSVVTLTSTGGGTIAGERRTLAGMFSATLKSGTTPSLATVTATCGSASLGTDVTFAGSPIAVQVTVVPSTLPADGAAIAVVTATVLDSGNRPVADGTTVAFSTTRGTITATSTTDNGKALARLTASDSAGTGVVTALSGSAGDTEGFTLQ